ncbi:hypothetical protein [Paenibacillus ihumii]|uniref:hypothetical protein n=1 Tax=Paenibacillus ihumii TaxID=687436 RepID=UPI0009F94A19
MSEELDASVKWDSAVRTVYINTAGFEPSEDKQGLDQVVEKDLHGFKVKYNTGSKLEIKEGEAQGTQALMAILIDFGMWGEIMRCS